jgi:hypothetical protein
MSYSGSVNPSSVVDSYVRFGGDVKPIDVKKVAAPSDKRQASIAPTQSPTRNLVASIQRNPSYSQGGSVVIHDVNNIVMPIMSV